MKTVTASDDVWDALLRVRRNETLFLHSDL